MPLTDTDREILDAWGRTYMEPARRLSELEALTGLSRHVLNLRLTRLIDTREALEYAPGDCESAASSAWCSSSWSERAGCRLGLALFASVCVTRSGSWCSSAVAAGAWLGLSVGVRR